MHIFVTLFWGQPLSPSYIIRFGVLDYASGWDRSEYRVSLNIDEAAVRAGLRGGRGGDANGNGNRVGAP